MSKLAVRTENLTRGFGAVTAVDGLSFEITSGTIFGLLGPNGAGKTTTIHLLLGLLEPTSGRAEVLGLDTVKDAHEIGTRTGTLLEHHGLYEQMNARDNLEFYGRIWRMRPSELRNRIDELLSRIGLADRSNEPVGRWSRGMKQKLKSCVLQLG